MPEPIEHGGGVRGFTDSGMRLLNGQLDGNEPAMAKQRLTVRTSTPAQLATLIKNDIARWPKLVTDARSKSGGFPDVAPGATYP